jgi:hypothetical protein
MEVILVLGGILNLVLLIWFIVKINKIAEYLRCINETVNIRGVRIADGKLGDGKPLTKSSEFWSLQFPPTAEEKNKIK